MIATLFAAALAVSPVQQQPTHQQAMVCDANFTVALVLYRNMAEADPSDQAAAGGVVAAETMMNRAREARIAAAAREGISMEDSRSRTETYALANSDVQVPAYQESLMNCMQTYGQGVLSDVN